MRQIDPAKIWLTLFLAIFSLTTRADIALYHSLELDLTDATEVQIFIPVHAPELMFDRESTDFADIGKEWLDGLSDAEMKILLERAEDFLKERFRIRAGKWDVQVGFPFSLEKSDDETALGSLLARTTFPNPGGELSIGLSPKSEKRLQIAINRPKQFPDAHDLAAGEAVTIPLPENPNPPKNRFGFWLKLMGIPLAVFAVFWVARFFRRGKIRA